MNILTRNRHLFCSHGLESGSGIRNTRQKHAGLCPLQKVGSWRSPSPPHYFTPLLDCSQSLLQQIEMFQVCCPKALLPSRTHEAQPKLTAVGIVTVTVLESNYIKHINILKHYEHSIYASRCSILRWKSLKQLKQHTSQPWQTYLSPPLECWYSQQVHANQHPPSEMQGPTPFPQIFSKRNTSPKTDMKLIAKYVLLHIYLVIQSLVFS